MNSVTGLILYGIQKNMYAMNTPSVTAIPYIIILENLLLAKFSPMAHIDRQNFMPNIYVEE